MFQRAMIHDNTSFFFRKPPGGTVMRSLAALLSAACVLCSAPAVAQGATSAAVSTGTGNPYKACNDGTTNEDRATCLKEAGAAKLEAQRGNLTSPAAATDQNALQRCDALPPADKEPCRLRITGAGTTSGSVAGGGVLREVVTVVPSGPVMPMPAPAPMPDPVMPGK
ncbi:MAG: hypothetical protein H7327_01885 [Herminiimonas sp.]|nr:hypothetical protein [Herminiimonas sp.]